LGGSGTNPKLSRTSPEVLEPVSACSPAADRLTLFEKFLPIHKIGNGSSFSNLLQWREPVPAWIAARQARLEYDESCLAGKDALQPEGRNISNRRKTGFYVS
jgi:hypothetical protein